MSERTLRVILFAHPGRLPTGLRVLLRSIFPNVQIEQTESFLTLLALLAMDQPWLVLIDVDLLANEDWDFWESIKKKYSWHQYLFLAHYTYQYDRILLVGLPALLWEGMTVSSLTTAIAPFFNNNEP
jgi:hypothetical protein